MKILCWNVNESVWSHWLKIVPSDASLIRALSMDELKAVFEKQNHNQIDYCFIYLDGHNFSQMVENAVLVRRAYPHLKIIVFPNRPSQTAALRVLSQGINGQCSPYIGKKQLETVLSVVGMGEIWSGKAFIDNLIVANSMGGNVENVSLNGELKPLSEKEREVVSYISQGLSNKQIASEMLITERTVKSHMTSIFKKTNTKDRLSLSILVQKSNTVH
ncbi:response regulator transcription factor [Marinomonas sp. 15G1-11]|uniref:Response regulator transcription factor n=1 Tax=Marinomonas phaeophyticola TaxID=3004091 RepID=A0ABT4JYE0_9GAMM|nr:response regulator transcription factor [Marinomonas sp. 15G1-11]MCZ2723402.1 response regulator transcription factor [Marinomonas sp. 15G1-11]